VKDIAMGDRNRVNSISLYFWYFYFTLPVCPAAKRMWHSSFH